MSYIDGFVIPVPTANRQAFIDHARRADAFFMEHGATRIVEGWGVDVPQGKVTDFAGAVAATPDETVAFSWIEWPDKAARDGVMKRMDELIGDDPRWDPAANPMPFDGQRMIYGGFQPIVELGRRRKGSYVQGFVLSSSEAKREAYRTMAEEAWAFFAEYGALRVVEGWQDDVPAGKRTDFFRAVKAEPGETVLFSFIEWPSKEVCDEAAKKMESDERMKAPDEMPFDAQRMIYGGFTPVVELGEVQ